MKAAFERGAALPDVQVVRGLSRREGSSLASTAEEVLVGSPRFLAGRGVDLARLHKRIETLEVGGADRDRRGPRRTCAWASSLWAMCSDRTRSRRSLRYARAGLKTILITGDNERAARRVAREVGIDEVHAGVLPQDKAGIDPKASGAMPALRWSATASTTRLR